MQTVGLFNPQRNPPKPLLKRSISTPEKGNPQETVSNPVTSQDDTDTLTQTLAQTTIQDNLPKFFKPIRNQISYSVAHRIPEKMQTILQIKRTQMGRVAHNDAPNIGLSGGILISESHMLVTKHGFGHHDPTAFSVQFELLNNHIYRIFKALSTEEAQQMGLQTGDKSDLMVIQLAEHSEGYPGCNDNHSPIRTPDNKRPAILHFLGFTSGNQLKESTMPGRPIAITEVVQRGKDTIGQQAVWNNFNTHGQIVEQSPSKSGTQVQIQSPARLHEWTVSEHTVSRKNGTPANIVNECYVLYPNIYGTDHVRLAHRTNAGSSGGIYFTEEGALFAVHCGRLPSNKDYPEHIAFYPWTVTVSTIYDDRLVYEAKPISLDTMLSKHYTQLQPNQYTLTCQDQIIGAVIAVKKDGTGYQFTVQPTDTKQAAFTLTVPFDRSATILVNDSAYSRSDISFTYKSPEKTTPTELVEALYRASLDDLIAGRASHEIPYEEQITLGQRIRDNTNINHSMTSKDKKLCFKHTSIGEAQQNAAHYEFIKEPNNMIAIHALGTHKDNTSYKIKDYSAAFKESAIANKLWTEPKQPQQPQPIFRLK